MGYPILPVFIGKGYLYNGYSVVTFVAKENFAANKKKHSVVVKNVKVFPTDSALSIQSSLATDVKVMTRLHRHLHWWKIGRGEKQRRRIRQKNRSVHSTMARIP
jgi:hypothetical protein